MKTLLSLLAALAILFAAWFLPLPPLVAGEDELAEARMPSTRQAVETARSEFVQAQAAYRDHISSHDLGALRASTEQAVADARAVPGNTQALGAVKGAAEGIAEYTEMLRRYAEASERYLSALRQYDDELMAWTRALRAASESLRDETWPIVEHLKLYPEPVGLAVDPPQVKPAQVAQQLASLQEHLDALSSGSQTEVALDRILGDIAGIWESGRSVEYVAGVDERSGLHGEYYRVLRAYDQKVQAAASQSDTGPGGLRQMLAYGMNLALGAVVLAGLAALFRSKGERAG